ncbi:MAG TPA: V-type ATP synthase subunit I [Oscillospiraceae bacterium]|nr:V-type ATP synthase subunit I [Oscillospiraceae bacterium]
MSKVTLLAHQTDKKNILELLQQSGVLEISDLTEQMAAEEAFADFLEQDHEQEAMQAVEKSMAEVRFNLDFLNRYHRVNKGLLDDILVEKEVLTLKTVQEKVPHWAAISSNVYQTLKAVDEKLMSLRNEETRLQNLQRQLQPWQQLTITLPEITNTKAVRLELGTVPVTQLKLIESQLAAAEAACYLEEIDSQRGEAYILLAYHHQHAELVQNALKQVNFNRQQLPQLPGTVVENLRHIEQGLTTVTAERKTALAQIAEQVQHRQTLQYYLDYLTVQREKNQAVDNLARTDSTFVLQGWVPTAEVAQLQQRILALSETIGLTVSEPEEGENFPVKLENKPFFAPFEFVTKLYGIPSPYGIDPTASFTAFFIIFFGFCLTDAGYGLVLMLLAGIGLRKIKGENMRKLLKILFWGGLSTVVIGWLVGGWFSYQIIGAPLAFDALANPILLLGIALGIGVVHIFYGMGVKFVSLVRQGKTLDALFDVGLWYVLLTGLGLLALPSTAKIGKYMALAGAIGLILTQGRSQPTILKKFFSGLVSLYDITGYFSDILSYSRLLALGLATGVVGLAINTMAGLLVGSPIGWIPMVILLIGGHTFNLAINGLGSFIHSSRLQYIEFYNRFYEGGGRAFAPFRFNTRHMEIQQETTQHE